MGCSPTLANPCTGSSSGRSSGGSGENKGLFWRWLFDRTPDNSAEEARQQRLAAATAANEKGREAFYRRDWATAAAYFQQAIDNKPDDPVLRDNLAKAQANMSAAEGAAAAERERQAAAERQRQAEAERQRLAEAERIERERLAEEQRKRDAEFIRDRDAVARTLRGSSGGAMAQLRGFSDTGSSGLRGGGGSAFDTSGGVSELRGGTAADRGSRSQVASLSDTSVVDARVPRDGAALTAQVPELRDSPAADRITKGFQAVMNRDWPVALAWWQDALQRDPGNTALKRSVELAQWMVARRKDSAVGPATPLGAAFHSAARGDRAGAIRQFEQAKADRPDLSREMAAISRALDEASERQFQAEIGKYWDLEIRKQTRLLVEGLLDTGMRKLIAGDDEGAQKALEDAEFFGLSLPPGE